MSKYFSWRLFYLIFLISYVQSFRINKFSFNVLSLSNSYSKIKANDNSNLQFDNDCSFKALNYTHQTKSALCSDGPITLDELSDQNIVKIVQLTCTDDDANVFVWKCLGYSYDDSSKTWDNSNVFPKWKEKYPQPIDLIGVTRDYHPSIDKPVRTASMTLMKGIPRSFKGGLRQLSSTVGFQGFKISELTPNITRRAQIVNWLIYYRESLFGKTLDQLKAERLKEEKIVQNDEDSLPSEKQFQINRLDS